MTSSPQSSQSASADRVFRSGGGLAGGGLLLALALWLGIDAMLKGGGRTPWLALGGLLLAAPLVVAFTLRPAVFAGADRLRIRNPFRMITVPWAAVAEVRARYSTEVVTKDGRRFQMWAVPVSLRQRKRATRRQVGASQSDPTGRTPLTVDVSDTKSRLAVADQTVRDLRELAEGAGDRPAAQGEPAIRWAYEIIAPAVVGFVLLLVLFATG